ncbi:hypothetical protein Taro_052554 [Colocasia esculenta]|uniref:Uncharacterized protein n=1 Tax=Colocasia esculenta TaxID=4460 RepID=A0A843XK99_COLES|nr:hypothetical protein [Colocasia esculenta]
MCVAGSVTPSVVTSSVGSPRFRGEPDTWVCSGFVPVQWYRQGLVVFLNTLILEESCRPTEGKMAGTAACESFALLVGGTDTSCRHWSPTSPFPVPHSSEPRPGSLEVPGMGLRSCGLQAVVMADRRDWGGGGDDPEESTQRMIERIWESLTEIQMRMDQTVEEAAQWAAVLERTSQARQSQSQAGGSGSFRLPQQSQGISKGKAPSGASLSGIAKWGKQIKKFFQGGGRDRGRQQGFQQGGFQQGRGYRGARRVLIATPWDVAFWLPLFWHVVCMRATCCARGGRADVDRRIATGNRVVT